MATKTGTNSSDVLTGTTYSDTISGLGGNDLINALDGDDNLSGGAGNDFINGGGGIDVILGNEDDDIIDGGAGNDLIDGGAGNDIIIASEGSDDASGGTGNDTFVVHGAAGDLVTINDSAGIDTLDFSLGSTSATIDLRSGASSFVDGREIVINGGSVTLPLDFVLLQDLSGSFSDDVATLRDLVPDLVTQLQGLQPDVRFGVASFVDKPTSPFGSEGDYVYQTDLALTSSGSDFQTAVDNLVVRSGGDTPEAQIEALMQLALHPSELGFRSGALHAVVVATDAPPHVAGDFAGVPANNGDAVLDGGGIGEDYPSVDQVRSALVSAGIVPIFAVTEDVLSVYQDLVAQLGFGTVIQLSSDSADIVDAISEGLEAITTVDIENAIGTAQADTITGNDLDNRIDGGAGNDLIDGGAGNDSLYGRKGNDTFLVSAAGDTVFEAVGEGNDTVRSSVSYTLAAAQSIETLRTTLDTGTGAINLTGNELANKIVGNDGANVLDGGAGIDALYGRKGNDTYIVSVAGDEVFETAGQGTDTVRSSVSYTLAAAQSIETLRTTLDTGTGAINLTGNELANKIVGNDGANLITGNGGADVLYGRSGADKFVFKQIADSTVAETGRDIIDDFSRTEGDKIDLALIDAVAGGTVNQAFKFIGSVAFHERAGELRAVVSGSNTVVSGDVNGDGTADFSFLVKGTLTLQAGDFIL